MPFDPFQPPLLIPIFVVGVYCAMAFANSWGGWQQLAKTYAAKSRPVGTIFPVVTGWVASFGSSYGKFRNVNVLASPEGIYVETQPWSRLFHRPLLFPWSCVTSIEPKSGILCRYTLLTISAGSYTFRLRLPNSAAEELQSFIAQSFQ